MNINELSFLSFYAFIKHLNEEASNTYQSKKCVFSRTELNMK